VSSAIILEIAIFTVQVFVLIPIVYGGIRLSGRCRNSVPISFFIFAMVSYSLEDLYWIVYDFLRPHTRMPFSSDEIAKTATLLLLGACLTQIAHESKNLHIESLLFSILFIGLNIVLWILWSGEWVQDIVCSPPYIYFLYVVVSRSHNAGVYKKSEKAVAVAGTFAVFALNFAAIIFKEYRVELDIAAYVVMFIVTGLAVAYDYKGLLDRDKDNVMKALYTAFFVFFWSDLVLFMCEGVWYIIASALNILTLPVLYFALKRWALNDIR
jgi:hypothetical protein